MPVVVTDTGCLIALERIGRLELLPALFGEVVVPPAVLREFGKTYGWLRVQRPALHDSLGASFDKLDHGEREAIALAHELQCLLIIDERDGRSVARQLDLEFRGTLGVLALAKAAGLVPLIAPLILELEQAEFFMRKSLRTDALRDAGEL